MARLPSVGTTREGVMNNKEAEQLRHLAHEIIIKPYEPNASAKLSLLKAHIDRALEELAAKEPSS